MSYVDDRPSGFTTSHVSQEFIEVVQDSELANRIEKERTKVINALGKKKQVQVQRDELPRPDPYNIDCPVCSLSSGGGQRVVMARVESNSLTPIDAIDSDSETWDLNDQHEIFYFCENCNMRVYRDDPSFEDYAATSPHDALTVVAINDPNDGSHEPIMVSQQNQYTKRKKKQERQHGLDKIMDQLTD